jgi:VanZ family protein
MRLKCWLPALLWMGLIFFLSSRSTLPGPDKAFWDILLKKIGHFTVFGILAWLYVLGLRSGQAATPRALWIALGMTLLYALSDELHQSYVPGRHARVTDWLIDAAGAMAALLMLLKRSRGFDREAPATQA